MYFTCYKVLYFLFTIFLKLYFSATSNLRAENYSIPPADRLKSKASTTTLSNLLIRIIARGIVTKNDRLDLGAL